MLPTCRNKQKQSLTVSLYSVVLLLALDGFCWLLQAKQGQTLYKVAFFTSLFPHSFLRRGGGRREGREDEGRKMEREGEKLKAEQTAIKY